MFLHWIFFEVELIVLCLTLLVISCSSRPFAFYLLALNVLHVLHGNVNVIFTLYLHYVHIHAGYFIYGKLTGCLWTHLIKETPHIIANCLVI